MADQAEPAETEVSADVADSHIVKEVEETPEVLPEEAEDAPVVGNADKTEDNEIPTRAPANSSEAVENVSISEDITESQEVAKEEVVESKVLDESLDKESTLEDVSPLTTEETNDDSLLEGEKPFEAEVVVPSVIEATEETEDVSKADETVIETETTSDPAPLSEPAAVEQENGDTAGKLGGPETLADDEEPKEQTSVPDSEDTNEEPIASIGLEVLC